MKKVKITRLSTQNQVLRTKPTSTLFLKDMNMIFSAICRWKSEPLMQYNQNLKAHLYQEKAWSKSMMKPTKHSMLCWKFQLLLPMLSEIVWTRFHCVNNRFTKTSECRVRTEIRCLPFQAVVKDLEMLRTLCSTRSVLYQLMRLKDCCNLERFNIWSKKITSTEANLALKNIPKTKYLSVISKTTCLKTFSHKSTLMRWLMTLISSRTITLGLTRFLLPCLTNKGTPALQTYMETRNFKRLTNKRSKLTLRLLTVRNLGEPTTVYCLASRIGFHFLPTSWFKSKMCLCQQNKKLLQP